MEESGLIKTERIDGRFIITLSHEPDNKLTEDLIQEIATSLDSIKHDEDLRLVIFQSGLDGVFGRGFEIRDRAPERVGPLLAAFGHMIYILNEIPFAAVCEVDGPCLGGSMELASFCDIVIASDRSRFGHPEVRAGVFPPVAAALYPHLIGRNRTMELLLTGREISAQEAFDFGLVNRIFPTNEFLAMSERLYTEIERASAVNVRLTRKAIETALYEKVLVAIRTTENIYLNELLTSHDAREGIQARLEGREPKWKNR